MNLKPLHDRVIVYVQKEESVSKGGIIIPESSIGKTTQGAVMAVGDDPKIKVKAGDVVLFEKYAGTTVEIEGQERLVIKSADILAVLE